MAKYEMATEKPEKMDTDRMLQLSNISFAPYIQLSTMLIGKQRRAGGNMFRHQVDTMGILIDYGYIDSVLLKASVVHDTVEDIEGFDENLILNADSDGKMLRTDKDLNIKLVVIGILVLIVLIAIFPDIPVSIPGALIIAIFGFFFGITLYTFTFIIFPPTTYLFSLLCLYYTPYMHICQYLF